MFRLEMPNPTGCIEVQCLATAMHCNCLSLCATAPCNIHYKDKEKSGRVRKEVCIETRQDMAKLITRDWVVLLHRPAGVSSSTADPLPLM
jgi:hypothetical protein